MTERGQWRWAAIAGFACVASGIGFVAQRAVIAGSDATVLAFYRHFGAAAAFVAAGLVLNRLRFRFAARDLLAVTALGLWQFAAIGIVMSESLRYIPAARATLIMTTMPLLTLFLASFMGQERLTLGKLAGCIVAAFGVAAALSDRPIEAAGAAWKGDALMFAATIGGAVNAVLMAPLLRRYGTFAVTTTSMAVGALALFVLLVAQNNLSGLGGFAPSGWLAIATIMIFGGAIALYLWFWALEHTAPSRVVVTISLNPVSAAVTGALVLGEAITGRVLLGLLFVIAGIAIAYWPGPQMTAARE
jgi:drug/metabolite transporter (DMT)-like permease